MLLFLRGYWKIMIQFAKHLFLAVAVVCVCAAAGEDGASARGTFVQRKVLRDVDVTLTSSGTWSFEKDRAFVWRTVKPVPSEFSATPTNYSFSAGGRTTTRRLAMKIEDIAQVFEIKEMKEFVEHVEASQENPVFSAAGIRIPSSLKVFFKNGDRLEISLSR